MRSWAALGAYVGGLGAVLSQCWRSWAALGPTAVLARAWGHSVRSWAALGAYVVGLGPLLGPILAVLSRSWALCWRSWAALGAYVGDLGPLLALMLVVLAALGPYLGGLGGLEPKSGPNPSGKTEKWPKPEREQGAQKSRGRTRGISGIGGQGG